MTDDTEQMVSDYKELDDQQKARVRKLIANFKADKEMFKREGREK